MNVQYFKYEINWKIYFFVTSILALTGFEYFYRAGILIVPLGALAAIYFINKNHRLKKNLFLIICPFLISAALQTFLEFNQSIFSALFMIIAFLTYFLIAQNVGYSFPQAFINVVFAFAIISLIFYPLTFSITFMDFINSKVAVLFKSLGVGNSIYDERENSNIIIYNFKNYAFSYNRNSGPFWEPGMFAIFLNIALYFNLIMRGRLLSFKNIILIIAILTTLSTTGYIALSYIILIYLIYYHESILKPLYIILLIISGYYIYTLDFIQEKVTQEIKYSTISGSSRFGAILVHMKVFSDFPFTGVGDGAARFISKYTDADSTPNGISFVFVKYGFILAIFYFYMLFCACRNIIRNYGDKNHLGIPFFILLLLLAFSQDITVRHLYLFLIVWGFFLPTYKINLPRNNIPEELPIR